MTPYAAAAGAFSRCFRYYAGWRRDEIDITNDDLINPRNSFQRWAGVNSPKVTLSLLPRPRWYVPVVSLSFGQAFFTEDPRIGTGSVKGSPVARQHAYQLVASKTLGHTDLSPSSAPSTTAAGMPASTRFLQAATRAKPWKHSIPRAFRSS